MANIIMDLGLASRRINTVKYKQKDGTTKIYSYESLQMPRKQKVSSDLIASIRDSYANGKAKHKISKEYSVPVHSVRKILDGEDNVFMLIKT